MANELSLQTLPVLSGINAYAVISNAGGLFWNTGAVAFQTYSASQQANYAVSMTEQGSTGLYLGNFPTAIQQGGLYSVTVFQRAGGSPASTDDVLGFGTVNWGGGPLAGSDLITLSYAKAFLKLSVNTFDALISSMITAASQAVKDYCRRDFVLTGYSEFYNLDDYQIRLTVKNYPIQTLTSVTLFPYDSSPQVNAGADYIIADYGTIAVKPTSQDSWFFPPGFQSVQVIYTAGYGTIPADLQLTTAKIVQRLFNQAGKDPTYLSEKLGDYQYQLKGDAFAMITADLKEELKAYKTYIL